MPGSKHQKPKLSTLKVASKRGRVIMRGKGKAIFVMPVIAFIYRSRLAGLASALAWLVSEVRAFFG